MSENTDGGRKPHIEVRMTGHRKFYAPDRDLLYLYHSIMKAAIGATEDICPEAIQKEVVEGLVDAVLGARRDAMSICSVEDVIKRFRDALRKIPPQAACLFVRMVAETLIGCYVNAIRDAAEKPVLSEEQITSALRSVNLISLLSPECVAAARSTALTSGLYPSTFGQCTGLFEAVKPDEEAKE